MNLEVIIGSNILLIFIGYLIGSVNFSIIFSKKFKKEDIREKGSKNAGATNIARNYGMKLGLYVFFLDVSKSFWFGIIIAFMRDNILFFEGIITQLALLFVIIGHVFPIFFKFKGGKGATTNLGMIASLNIVLAIIGAVIFFFILFRWKIVSLGSIIPPFIIVFFMLIPWMNSSVVAFVGYSEFYQPIPFSFEGAWYLSFLFLFLAALIILYTHRLNIKRLILKKESVFDFGSKKSNKKNKIDYSS